ncbi:MAG: geranylgeranylglyceryl/heptaprenylglyceryl phosphate synthase [Candidatus Micrarchaeota archaeon]|nr:geranylgeranylglyceryl/heptaprenylglyceryl phosphate synthase [Candidatus Micrarchaeota archaeon]
MRNIIEYLYEKRHNGEKLLFSVIDPLDYPSIDSAVKVGVSAYEAGFDMILVGGSIGVQGELLDETVRRIKENVSVPVVLFPGNISTVTKYADGIYFMSLLNSRNPYWITRVQLLALPIIKRLNIQIIPTAYVVVEPGGTVGWVGDVDLIPQSKPKLLSGFASLAEVMGFKIFLADVGSNADRHVPLDGISEMSENTKNILKIVAGGIKTPGQLRDIYRAGADGAQIGTVLERGEAPELFARVKREWK